MPFYFSNLILQFAFYKKVSIVFAGGILKRTLHLGVESFSFLKLYRS